jgi:uncharacterized protein involved in response to NO
MTFSHTSHSASQRLQSAARPSFEAVFSYGFRPLFLGSAVYAALVMVVWIAWIASAAAGWSQNWLPVAGSAFAWHAHEMVFGFAAAAIGGFLLTAVPNWTGALPLSGLPLVLVFVAWLLGRLAMDLSATLPYAVVAALDVVFLPLLGGFAGRQLFTRPALRNLVFLALISALTLCDIFFHLANAGYLALDPLAQIRTSMLLVIVMIAIIGGRIIPAFTHNWLHGNRPSSPMPRRIAWLDRAALASLFLFVLLEALGVAGKLAGAVAAIAAIANGARLAFWGGSSARKEPIVWILHLGYAWIVVGLVLSALAAFTSFVPGVVASHAFGTGAIGTMIIAVMSRASLGHTGRRLIAPRSIVWAYYLVTLAAVLRVAGPLIAPQQSAVVLSAAALAWVGAFLLFVAVYAPILTTPRVHTKVAHR